MPSSFRLFTFTWQKNSYFHETNLRHQPDDKYCNRGITGGQVQGYSPLYNIRLENTHTHTHIYGFEDMACFAQMLDAAYENKRLRGLMFSLTKLFIIYRGIVNNLNDKNQRLFAVKDKILASAHTWAKTVPQSLVVKLLNVTAQQYAAWKKGFYCKYSPVRFCRKIVPTQLTFEETCNITRYVSNPKLFGWSLASVYHLMMRETHRYFSIKTFYKYVQLLGLRHKRIKFRKHNRGIRATKLFEILHIDITEYKVSDNIKVFIYMVVDNFSRKILGCRIDVIKSAQLTMENLRQVYDRYNIALLPPVITVMSDDGSENHSVTGQFFEEKPNLVRIIAGEGNNHSNNMIEAVFRKIKECFIYQKEYSSIADFTARTITDIAVYNGEMPLNALDGSTPDEAFKFLNPYFSHLSDLMHITQTQRIEENKSGRCF